MRSLTLVLFALIAVTVVNCKTDEEKAAEYAACVLKLTKPTCAATNGACETAYNTYNTCSKCTSSDSVSSKISCIKDCGSTFKSDTTAKSDATVATYVDGMNTCLDILNGSLLALSALVLSVFALLF